MNKGGFAADARATPTHVSPSGEAIEYMSNAAFPSALGNTAVLAAHVSTRSATGWTTSEWTPAVPQAEALNTYLVSYDFSDDLSHAFLEVPSVPLAAGAAPNVENVYLRSASGSYSLINAAEPTVSGEKYCGSGQLLRLCWAFVDGSSYAGASSDLSHVIFESSAQLTPEAPPTFTESLYENDRGHVKLVGILPDGTPAAGSTAGAGSNAFYPLSGQTSDKRVQHAISSDGLHVVFQAPDPAQSNMTEVYDRLGGSETTELSKPAPGATPPVTKAEPATFWAASVDGSKVLFTSSAELTTESNTGTANGGEDLYEYDTETDHLTDLTVDTNPEDIENGAAVKGVVDISTDGAYVYFVAAGVLDSGKGLKGQPNLYLEHDGGKPIFITTLSSSGICELEEKRTADSCDWTQFPVELEAYVTPDGRHMAFMSTMSLSTANFPSGYDNTDQNTGQADTEVYGYSAPTGVGEAGRLVCASCDPTGSQPIGNALLGGVANTAPVPEVGTLKFRGIGTPFYRVHAMSDSGARLFYTAPVSQSEPFEQVHEYEVNGEGTCAKPGGCRYLLSNGGGESDQFLDASASGADVYLATQSRLVPSDRDELRDVYDARIDGGIQMPTEAACESNCRQASGAPTTQPPVSVGTGLSGNLSPPATSKVAEKKKCRKGYRPRRGRCVKEKRARRTSTKRRAR